eukprot:351012-Chlamydomonas_euryale.AAC.1
MCLDGVEGLPPRCQHTGGACAVGRPPPPAAANNLESAHLPDRAATAPKRVYTWDVLWPDHA